MGSRILTWDLENQVWEKTRNKNESKEEMKGNDDHTQMNVDKIPHKSQQMRLTDMGFERK